MKDPARGDFSRYDRLLHSVYGALSTENEALYRSWASPAGFEQVLMAKLAGAIPEVAYRAGLVHTRALLLALRTCARNVQIFFMSGGG